MFDIFNDKRDMSYMEDSGLMDQNVEPNVAITLKEHPSHSMPAGTDHNHMHHDHQAANDIENIQNVNNVQDHDMLQIHNSMQNINDIQTAHAILKMHESHGMSMNGSHSMEHFGRSPNATDMSLGVDQMSGHDHSGHNMDHNGHNMDHSGHNMDHMSHGSMNHMSHGGMAMTFHGGVKEVILFSWWNINKVPEFIGSFVAIFFIALLYEGLKYYRKHLLWKTYSGLRYCAVSPPDKAVANICATDEAQVIQPVPHTVPRNIPTMLSSSHVWQTLLHGIQVLVSYLLMLIFMTYNTWLCSAVVLGSATGYFLFGWRESVVVDFTEHCH